MQNMKSTGYFQIDQLRDETVNLNFNMDQPQIFNLADTEMARKWTSVRINWQYPRDYLLLIIESPFTYAQKSYEMRIKIEHFLSQFSRVVRIVDGNEIDVNSDEFPLTFLSDSNHQVILKFFATPAAAYMALIEYEVVETITDKNDWQNIVGDRILYN